MSIVIVSGNLSLTTFLYISLISAISVISFPRQWSIQKIACIIPGYAPSRILSGLESASSSCRASMVYACILTLSGLKGA